MSDPGIKVIEIEFDTAAELEEAYQNHISKGGYFLPTDSPEPRTTPVELRFSLPGVTEPLVIRGEVAYAATPDAPMPGMGAGMAVQFDQISKQMSTAFKAAITIARAEGMGGGGEVSADAGPESEEGFMDEDGDQDDDSGDQEDGEDLEEESEESAAKIMAQLNMQSGESLYFTIRKMPLHQKITAAKRGNRSVRNILIQEGNKKIINFMLQNPGMSTPEVIQMLKMTNLSQEIIQAIAKNSSWSQSEEVRYHIVINPKTPLPMALNTLIALNQNSLAKIAKSGAVKAQIKSNALKLLEQRRRGT